MFKLTEKMKESFRQLIQSFTPAYATAGYELMGRGSCGSTCSNQCDGSCRGTCTASCQRFKR